MARVQPSLTIPPADIDRDAGLTGYAATTVRPAHVLTSRRIYAVPGRYAREARRALHTGLRLQKMELAFLIKKDCRVFRQRRPFVLEASRDLLHE